MGSATDFVAALRWLYSLAPRGIRLELDRMRAALASRGNPHRGLRAIHVAGTNGKGSVSACCDAALRAAGLRVGLYTSPHLHRFAERVRVGGRPIPDREVCRRLMEIREFLENHGSPALTFFEVTTLLAFEAFRDARVDVAVFEVGLGGRLDATNALEAPLVSVITRVALDHQAYLGPTVAAIAAEKAGIVRAGVPVVLGAREPEVRAVVRTATRAAGAGPLWTLDEEVRVEQGSRGRFTVHTPVGTVAHLRIGLPGDHQRDNAALVVAALHAARARGIPVDDDAIRAGLSRVRWPGRLERVRRSGRSYLFDAAHNPDGCEALAAHLRRLQRTVDGPRVLLFGAMADKEHAPMLASLAPEVDAIVLTRPATARAADPESLRAALPNSVPASARAEVHRDPRDALVRASASAGPGGLVVVAGSIYLLAEVRAAVLGLRSDPPIAM